MPNLRPLVVFVLTAAALAHPVSAQQDVAAPPQAGAPAGRYELDLSHASLTWRISHNGMSNYTARFARFDATLDFDPARPERSRIVATIDPTSVRTDFPVTAERDWDAELSRDARFFQSAKFPQIRFRSTNVVRTGPDTANIRGDLTFLGVTRPIVLAAKLNGGMAVHPMTKKPAVGFSARGVVKRSDYGMNFLVGQGIGDEVEVIIEAEFQKN